MHFFTKFSMFVLVSKVLADCECGFRDEENRLWMDGLVIPFDKVGDLSKSNDVWLNDYVHSKGHGNYTYSVQPENVYLENGELVLKVTPPVGDTIGSAQLSSRRKDLYYGTYRSEMYLPPQKGSCVGFFHYHNDTEEIDIEYIGQNKDMLYFSSKRTNPRDYSTDIDYLNLIYKSGTLQTFRDYRFDWTPNQVDFYVDNDKLYSAKDSIPSTPARVMLMNWGNGDLNWSDLPKENVYAKFRNVRVFFNSTHPYVINHYAEACKAALNAKISRTTCDVATFSKTEKYGYDENVIRKFAVTGTVSRETDKITSAARRGTSFPTYGIIVFVITALIALFQ